MSTNEEWRADRSAKFGTNLPQLRCHSSLHFSKAIINAAIRSWNEECLNKTTIDRKREALATELPINPLDQMVQSLKIGLHQPDLLLTVTEQCQVFVQKLYTVCRPISYTIDLFYLSMMASSVIVSQCQLKLKQNNYQTM